ncbi:trehalose-6-phosphate synthase [Streptomyces griseus]|uniref:trehalose-6-phosphate synthase n=1 Tax=Streptomyces griseus TaxID=1911 RepID=UPI003CEA33AD
MSTDTFRGGLPVLVAAKAAPVVHEEVDGQIVPQLSVSTGSVVGDLAGRLSVSVVASAATPQDTQLADRHPDGLTVRAAGGQDVRVRFVRHSDETLSQQRYGLVTEILWQTLHGLWNRWSEPDFGAAERRAWQSLHTLNEDFAKELLAQSGGADQPYLVHDYQLALVPALLRAENPQARILYFHHIAWPGSDTVELLPDRFVADLVGGILGADVVGFFAERWRRNFLRTVEDLVPSVEVDHAAATIRVGDRVVRAVVEPLSYSPDAITGMVGAWPRELDAWAEDRFLIVHSGRTDPIKNAHRAVLAFVAASEHRSVAGARLLLRINPHRMGLAANAGYLKQVAQVVAEANATFGEERVRLLVGNDRGLTVGCLGRADAVVVNSLVDGQNLTAFEAVAVGGRTPVLLLSPTCGASEVLSVGSLAVNPYDVSDQAEAIVTAVTMASDERAARFARMRTGSEDHLLPQWTGRQLRHLEGKE